MDKIIERPKPEILKDAPPSVIIGFVAAANNKLDQGHGSLPKCLFRFAKNLTSFQFNLTRETSGMPLFRSNPSFSQTSFLLIVYIENLIGCCRICSNAALNNSAEWLL